MSTSLFADLEQFIDISERRLMGLDLGSKTIGVAISDTLCQIASPLETIKRKKFSQDAAHLVALAAEFEIAGFVIGLPLNMDGTQGPRIQATHAFVRNMKNKTDLPFAGWDERMSSVAVERVLLEADSSRAARAQVIDKMAAGYILQGALDRLCRLRAAPE